MNKSTFLTQNISSDQLLSETIIVPFSPNRLIVLVPDSYFDPGELVKRICNLFSSNYSKILLLGLCSDSFTPLMLRQQLAIMASSMRIKNMEVEITLEPGKHWSKHVEQIWRSGDLIVGLTNKTGRLYRQELDEILQSNSQIPVHLISDFELEFYEKKSNLSGVGLWLGAVGIMAVFFWMQIEISHLVAIQYQSVFLYLSVFAEIAIIWGWNLMFP